jgi:PTS system nitrogen regulatory IIA component
MKLVDVLRKECVLVNVELSGKEETLQEIARLAKKCSVLESVSEQEIHDGLMGRESLGSTGFGKGIAIPHCRLKSATDFVVGIITVPSGVSFDALDGEKVRLMIFIIAPETQPNKHLKLLSAISRTLLIPGSVEEILAEKTTEAVFESFLRHTYAEIDTSDQTTKCLFNVFVQDKKVFRTILEKLTGVETSSLVVLNSENVSAYLTKVPLFADFWRDKPSSFSKMIVAVIDKRLVNEAIRTVESITGNLNECSGVMVTSQELPYAAGSL